MNRNEITTIYRELGQYKDPAHDLIRTMIMLFGNTQIAHSKKCFDLGFINSQNVKKNDSISHKKDYNTFLKNYLKMLDVYGKDAIMVTEDEFVNIINKYDLFCGPFENYQGEIPEDRIYEIEKAKKNLLLGRLANLHPYKLYCLSAIEFKNRTDDEIYKQIMRFPFYNEDLSPYGKSIIAERHGNVGPIRRYYYKEEKNLFIAAPKSQMGVNRLLEYEHLRQRGQGHSEWFQQTQQKRQQQWENQMAQTDPLICIWVPGKSVIILTAWGIEANENLLQMRKATNHYILDVINDLNPFYTKIYKLLSSNN